MSINKRDVVRLPHHERFELCTTRATYRQGKKITAVKVYTINDESQHLLVCGVPSLGLQDDLRRLGARFGDIKSLVFIPNYAEEEFTEAYHMQYTRIQSARYAKHHLDNREFFGGILHVCYLPEMESVAETRAKLIQRRKEVAQRTRPEGSSLPNKSEKDNTVEVVSPRQYHRRKKHPALPLTADRLESNCIWQGVPHKIDPRTIVPAPELLQTEKTYGPARPDKGWLEAGVREWKFIPSSSNTKLNTGSKPVQEKTSAVNRDVFRFIPRQVATKGKIIFRDKKISAETNSLKRNCEDLEGANESLHQSILEVRKKIRAVSVPNVQVVFDKNDPLTSLDSGPV